jgi:hypothetical protein
MKYIRKNKNFSLVYEGYELVVHDYLDASFQSDIENGESSWIVFYSK